MFSYRSDPQKRSASKVLLLLFVCWLQLTTRSVNGLAANPSSSSKKSRQEQQQQSDQSPYYSYKTFKRMGVPALVYSAFAKAAGRLVKLKPIDIAPSRTISSNGTRGRRRVALVTGSNTGVGFATAQTLVRDHGFEVIIACRNQEKGIQACQAINDSNNSNNNNNNRNSDGMAVFVQTLDLADFNSVRDFCKQVQEQYIDGIDVLVNNAGRNSAGSASSSTTTTSSSSDDVSLDLLFQTNFLGHFLLTNLLLDKCERVVNLSSVMHHFPVFSKKDQLKDVSLTDFWKQNALEPSTAGDDDTSTERKPYAPSKLAALLFSMELNRRYGKSKGIRSIAVNPGSVNSDIWRNYSNSKKSLFQKIYLTPEQGSTTSVAASVLDFDDEDVVYLQPYWIPFQKKDSPPYPLFEMLGPYRGYCVTRPRLPNDGGHAASKTLFDVCEELTGCKFPAAEENCGER